MALTGAMSAGISGLKAHMEALNTVGNNVANVNTYGYKPGRVTFRESIYSTQAAGSAGTNMVGGTIRARPAMDAASAPSIWI